LRSRSNIIRGGEGSFLDGEEASPVSELSEHDRAELQRIELELMTQDPRLARLLGSFGRRGARRHRPHRVRRLYLDILVLTLLAVVPLLVAFVR
jgi:Protein of unknown function (DUF3040)